MTRSLQFLQRLLVLAILFAGARAVSAQTNLLSDSGFEAGPFDVAWTNFAWKSGEDYGGVFESLGAGAHGGTHVMRMYAFGVNDHELHQDWPATAGRVYESEAWMRTVPGTNNFAAPTAVVILLMKFFNGSGVELASVEAPLFGSGGPTNWTLYSTGPTVAPAGTVTGRTMCLYAHVFDSSTASGAVLFDDVRSVTSTPSSAGALLNPGFEDQPFGTTLTNIPFWVGDGNAGATVTNFAKSGSRSLQIFFTETLAEQSWNATFGTKYATGAYVFSPSGGLHFQSSGTAHGIVLLEFFDAQTNLLITYESATFTPQSPTNQWVYLEAVGAAPADTAFAKTFVGIVGTTNGFGGSVFFDDTTQRVVATAYAGLLRNGGFDDGPFGNASSLYDVGDFLGWTWLGGTNAGFVTRDVHTNEEQSLVFTFPENLAVQNFPAVTSGTYLLEGYAYTPPGTNTLGGTAFGVLLIQFFSGPTMVGQAESMHFDLGAPTGQWVKLVAVGQAPGPGWVSPSARAVAALIGSTTGWSGSLFFDGLSLVEIGTQSEFQLWQYRHFGSTNGAGTAATNDFDSDRMDNWSEFIAGTAPTNSRSVFNPDSVSRDTNGAVVITWPSVSGRIYQVSRLTNLLAGSAVILQTGIVATLPENAYTDTPPAVPSVFYNLGVRTN